MTYVVGAVAIIMSIVGPFLVLRGAGLTRKSAAEATRQAKETADRENKFRHREETMRHLRWAMELALSDNRHRATGGALALDALTKSPLVQTEDVQMVHAISVFVSEVAMARRRPGMEEDA